MVSLGEKGISNAVRTIIQIQEGSEGVAEIAANTTLPDN